MADPFMKSLRSDTPKNRHSPLVKAMTVDESSMRGLRSELGTPGRQKPAKDSATDTPAKPPVKKSPLGSMTHRMRRTDSKPEESAVMPSPRAPSVVSTDDILTDDIDALSSDGDNVQVIVRIRPPNATETAAAEHYSCLESVGTRQVVVRLRDHDPRLFKYDQVLEEGASQDDVFSVAGMPVVDNCLAGYNSSIFAYGQTGSGKTHTVLGVLGSNPEAQHLRGLAPRVFEYLFNTIREEEDSKGRDKVRYSCTCSFLEIYNEVITDLLQPDATKLEIRENTRTGCYVEGLSQHTVLTVDETLRLMQRGATSRHVGETRLNRESSRSHSVFTCTIEKTTTSENGLKNVIHSRLNLIDLAGSERVKSGAFGGSQVQGEHLKETCYINSSLSTLGRVIRELVAAQHSGRKGHHIPYRESRLTFLLQDSLGGNAKTMIIANVSPSAICSSETISTLSFALRAKSMRNKAHINVDTQGDKAMLQREIQRLNTELDMLRKGQADPAIAENAVLRQQLAELDKAYQALQMDHASVKAEEQRSRRERERAEVKMAAMAKDYGAMQDKATDLAQRLECTEAAMSEADSRREAQQAAELRLAQVGRQQAEGRADQERARSEAAAAQASQLAEELEQLRQQAAEQQQQAQAAAAKAQEAQASLEQQVQQLAQEAEGLRNELADAVAAGQVLQSNLLDVGSAKLALEQEQASSNMEVSELHAQLEAARERLEQQGAGMAELSGVYESLRQQHARVVRELEAERASRVQAETAGHELQQQVEQLEQQVRQEHQHQQHSDQQAARLQEQLAALDAELSSTTLALQEHKEQVLELQQQLADGQEQLGGVRSAKADSESKLARAIELLEQQVAGLTSQLSDASTALEREQQQHASSQEQLADVQRQLEGAQRELSDIHQAQVEADAASVRLQSQLQKVNCALQAKEQQVTRLSEDLSSTSHRLEEEQQRGGSLQQQLDALQREQQELRSQLQREQQVVGSTQGQLEHEHGQRVQAQQQLQQLREQLVRTEAELGSRVEGLSRQLASEHEAHSSTQQQLQQAMQQAAQLKGQLAQQERLHSEHVAANGHQQERASSKMAQQQEQIAALRNQLHEVQERHASVEVELGAQLNELQGQLGGLRKEKADLLLYLAARDSELEALRNQLDGSRQQVDALQHKLDKEAHALALARNSADSMQQSLEQQLEQLQRAHDKAKADSVLRDREHQAQIHELHIKLVTEQEAKGMLESELRSKLTLLGKELELLRKAHGSLQAHADARQLELDRARNDLAEERDVRSKVEATLQDKERYISQLRKAIDDTSTQAEQEKSSLKKEQQQLMEQLTDKDSNLKDEIVRQARHQKAFGEIRRLIDWATTPPSSMRSSMRGSVDVGGELTSPLTSPRPRYRRFNSVYSAAATATAAVASRSPRLPTSAPTGELRASSKSPELHVPRALGRLTPRDPDLLAERWSTALGGDDCDLSASADQVNLG